MQQIYVKCNYCDKLSDKKNIKRHHRTCKEKITKEKQQIIQKLIDELHKEKEELKKGERIT